MAAAASSAKVVSKKRDPSLPPPPQRYSLPQLIERIPRPPPDTDKSEWQHKGGWGLKFYRAGWVRYAEPCYWTVTRYKPSTHGHKRKVWGVLTWRGETRRTHTGAARRVSGGSDECNQLICQSTDTRHETTTLFHKTD